jgi:glucose-1-phosphate adenylyltransferase
MSTQAMILAGGEGPALSVLTALRSEAAVPFGGKYRIIDFSLSNCVNSDIFDVAVLTQYQPRSLNDHIGVGRPWDLDRTSGGVRLLQPYQRTKGERGAWQEGTADALRFNLDALSASVDDVLILAGDHIYTMDYRPLLRFHRDRGADVTLAVRQAPAYEAHRYGMVEANPDGQIVDYEEKPKRTRSTLASMGIYVFKRKVLIEALTTGPGRRHHNLGGEVIPTLVHSEKVYAYLFRSYWADVGTLQAYYEANMALLGETPALDLHNPEMVIHTRSEERPAARLGPDARVEGSLLCDGCRVEGTVISSVISPGVTIAAGATVRDSILMTDARVEAGAVVDRAIVDKRVTVGANARLGADGANTPNLKWPERLNTGITVVGKRAAIPPGATIGRNVVIFPRAAAKDFPGLEVASGETIGG